jgi:hypothetical protein
MLAQRIHIRTLFMHNNKVHDMACLVFLTVLQECVAVSPLYKQAVSCRICTPWQVHVVRQLDYCKNLVHQDLRMPNDIQLAQHQYMVIGLESAAELTQER